MLKKVQPREKAFIFAAIAFIVTLSLVKTYIWSENKRDTSKRYLDNQILISELLQREEAKQKRPVESMQVDTEDASVISLINTFAKKNHIRINRLQPDGERYVTIWLEEVNFNSLVTFIHELTTKSNIILESATISSYKQRQNGLAQATLRLASK